MRCLLPTFALLLPGLAQAFASQDDLFASDSELPSVLTATRLKQAPAAVPGAMTVLDRELIRASGARDIAELMRLVPGMMVSYRQGNLATVNYHGSNSSEARRLQVLIDGRSVYRPGLATVDWFDLPLAIEDIERIEVFRGPNTVSYGANALLGVVNIISRKPQDSLGTRLQWRYGQTGINDWYASHGQALDNGALRLSLSGQADNGFDKDANQQPLRDDRRLNRLSLSAEHDLDSQQQLSWQLALSEGSNQQPYTYRPVFGPYSPGDQGSDTQVRDYAASVRWNIDLSPQHSLQLQGNLQHWEHLRSWRACDAALSYYPPLRQLWQMNPQFAQRFALSGFTATSQVAAEQALANQIINEWLNGSGRQETCGTVNQDLRESRAEIELLDTLSLTDDLRLLSGVSLRRDQADSQTYFAGSTHNNLGRLFGHLEWQASERWLLQGGAMYEYDQLGGDSLTPRLAVNYLLAPGHGLRALYSEAVRSPDLFESTPNWSYWITDISPNIYGRSDAYYFVSNQGPENLDNERMRSREIGYNGHFEAWQLSLDVKLFDDHISGLISEPLLNNAIPASNNSSISLRGMETQLDWRASSRDRLRLSYAYIEDDPSNPNDKHQSARHSGSTGWLADWGQGWSSSLFYYQMEALNEQPFQRLDLRLAKRLQLGSSQLELAGVWQQRLDSGTLAWREVLYNGQQIQRESRNDQRHRVYFTAELEF